MFKAVHDEERSGQPSVMNDLVENVDHNSCERWHFTISELLCEFPQMSCAVFYEIIIVRLSYHHKFCTRCVPNCREWL
jgi:hypothetical protein